MHKTVPVALNTMRVAGVGAIALGLAFWAGQLLDLIRIHMALGLLVVLAMWALSAVGLARSEVRGRAAVLFILGLAVLALGATQTSLLPGPQHWVVRAVHLLLGVIALRQGEVLARVLRGQSRQPGAQKTEADRLAATQHR
jgi:hypothetical protein